VGITTDVINQSTLDSAGYGLCEWSWTHIYIDYYIFHLHGGLVPN